MSDFQLDKKQLTKDLPFLLRGPVGSFIDWANNLDANHDGKKDIAQIAPVVIKVLPLLAAFIPLIDKEKFVQWICKHDWCKDADKVKEIIEKLEPLTENLAKLTEQK